ncbi:MAG: hypothetical protein FWD92_03635 [Methanomassiliicoccaceae archaeon]|nr:hypothetical protein [Methanomassiliicoccaceae archaeon]
MNENIESIEDMKEVDYRMRYFPVQALVTWKKEGRWKSEVIFSDFIGASLPHAAIVINEFGAPQIISVHELPDDQEVTFIPVQTGLYATVNDYGPDERYITGYFTKDFMPENCRNGEMGGRALKYYTSDMLKGKEGVKFCYECDTQYEILQPNFCVKCGSANAVQRKLKPIL